MTTQRTSTILRPLLALAIGVFTLVLLGTLVVGPARASTVGATAPPAASSAPISMAPTVIQTKGTIVQFGNDVLVPAGERVDSVLAAGGNVRIDGAVKGSVVAFGGDVLVRGTVGSSVVAFGGDVRLAKTASVGASLSANDKSVVLFGGSLQREFGAHVNGQVQHYDNANWSASIPWGAGHLFRQPLWWGFSLVGWLVQTAICLILGLVAAALMPKQMRAVQRHLARKPAASLGWGALTFFLIVPAILVVLVISIVGLLLVLPYVVVVALFYFFVVTSVGAFIAQRVLAGTQQRDNLMLAVTIGVVATTIIGRVPVVGGLVELVMVVFGTGAAVLAFAEWRRAKRVAAAPPPPAGAVAAQVPAGVAYATAGAAPAAASPTAVVAQPAATAEASPAATEVTTPGEAVTAVPTTPEAAPPTVASDGEAPAVPPAPPAEGPPAGDDPPPAT